MEEDEGFANEPQILDIADETSDEYEREKEFSHPQMVAMAYHCVLRNGAVEMIKGFWETRTDKYGNQLRSYHPDTRQIFINSVETLRVSMSADFDDEAKRNINQLLDGIAGFKKQVIEAETKWFNSLSYSTKQKVFHIDGTLNQDSIYYHKLIDYKVEVYYKVFEELEKLLSRAKYLRKKMFTSM